MMKKRKLVVKGWVSQNVEEGTGFSMCGPYCRYKMLYLLGERLSVYRYKKDIMDEAKTDDPSIIKKIRITIEEEQCSKS